jgi:BlaI family transcriptional regulator, penicillinase repressor
VRVLKEKSVKKLTRAEEQVMKILWDLEEGMVQDVRKQFPDPKPIRNTISTVIRILEVKRFVEHKTTGNVYVYYPIIKKEAYSKFLLFDLMENYFNNSLPILAKFLIKEKDLTRDELIEILEDFKRRK